MTSHCVSCNCSEFIPHSFKPQQCGQCFHSINKHQSSNDCKHTSVKQSSPPPIPSTSNIKPDISNIQSAHTNGGAVHQSDTLYNTNHDKQKYIVLYDYDKQDPRQLTIRENDILQYVPYNNNDSPDGWIYVQNMNTNEIGWVAELFIDQYSSNNNNNKTMIDNAMDSSNNKATTGLLNDATNNQQFNDKRSNSNTIQIDDGKHDNNTTVLPVVEQVVTTPVVQTTTELPTTTYQVPIMTASPSDSTDPTNNTLSNITIESPVTQQSVDQINTTPSVPTTTNEVEPVQRDSNELQPSSTNQRQVKTLYPFTGTLDSQLSFQPNEIYTVIDSPYPGWLSVLEHNNKIIPSNYITEYNATVEQEKQHAEQLLHSKIQSIRSSIIHNQSINDIRCVIVLYDYTAQYNEQLSVKRNDVLYIIDDTVNKHPGWLYAIKQYDSNQIGLVPENYVNDHIEPVNSTPNIQSNTNANTNVLPSTIPAGDKFGTSHTTTPTSIVSSSRSISRDEFDDMSIASFATAPAQQQPPPPHTANTQSNNNTPTKQSTDTSANHTTSNNNSTYSISSATTPTNKPSPPSTDSAPPGKPLKHMRALYKFDATDDEQLSFNVGDILIILEQTDDGWWYARHSSNNKIGYVPEPYLQLYTPPSSTTPIHSRQNSLLYYVTQSPPNNKQQQSPSTNNILNQPSITAQQPSTPPTRNIQPVEPYQAIVIRSYQSQYPDECNLELGTLIKINGLDTNTQMVRIRDIINDTTGLVPLKHTARVLYKLRTLTDCKPNMVDITQKQYLSYIRGDRIYQIGTKTNELGIGFLNGRIGLFHMNAVQTIT